MGLVLSSIIAVVDHSQTKATSQKLQPLDHTNRHRTEKSNAHAFSQHSNGLKVTEPIVQHPSTRFIQFSF